MFIDARLGWFFLATLLCTAVASAQRNGPLTQPGSGRIYLDIVVTQKSGPPVPGLQQQDFTLLDNKAPQTITSSEAVTAREARLEVFLVIDAVNTDSGHLAYERTEIDKFLRAGGGHLAYSTALAVFADKGIHFVGSLSTDGNALSAALGGEVVGLRALGRSGYFGATERLQLSLQALNELAASAAPFPGRNVIIWVSPGWPLLLGILPDPKQQREIFTNIVALSTQLFQARATLYSVDPLSAADAVIRDSTYKAFLKGVSKPSQVYAGDLGLQVLAVQSGGLALQASNDIARLLQECLEDTAPYYEISFDPPRAARPDEYHNLEIKLAKPGLIARTRQGYYAQPLPRD